MSIEEYFGSWMQVINLSSLNKAINTINTLSKTQVIYPKKSDIFKAFRLCNLRDLKVVFIGMEPYPQKDVATGIAFGNSNTTPEEDLSPSLKILRDSVIDYTKFHYPIKFDSTLESWAKQGILLLNSALTVEANKVGSHTMIWRQFISELLRNLSSYNSGIIYVLLGQQAQTFEPYINHQYNHILKEKHPSYYARIGKEMPHKIFEDIDLLIKNMYNEKIEWYKELTYGEQED